MSFPIKIKCIPVKQPIGEFLIGAISWSDLLKIAEADIRKIEEEDEKKNSLDSYLGIQRELAENRIKEIGNYVKTIDATFPTSIILAIDSKEKSIDGVSIEDLDPDYVADNYDKIEVEPNLEFDEVSSELKLKANRKIAKILDGQHRIEGLRRGFENLDTEAIPDFEFNVTIFLDLDIDDQAQVFSIINKAQTKVNKSLVYDLYEYAKSRSPQKTSHDIVRLLYKDRDSPFYKKIKILGKAVNKDLETIAQATIVELIMNYISAKPMEDRDILKRRTLFGGKKKLELETDPKIIQRRFFRNLFILEKDEIILSTLWNYFKVVQEKWPTSWNELTEGNILNRSTGVIALMRFLKPLYHYLGKEAQEVSQEEFKQVFDEIEISDGTFDKDIYVPGSTGQSRLYKELLEKSGIPG